MLMPSRRCQLRILDSRQPLPSNSTRPFIRFDRAVDDFHHRLAGPFSPRTAWISPGAGETRRNSATTLG